MIQGIDHEDNTKADKTEVFLKANTANTLPCTSAKENPKTILFHSLTN